MGTHVRMAVDIGGTFTDVILDRSNERLTRKVLTTTQQPEQGVLEGARLVLADARLHFSNVDVFVHGTTLATNAIIERRGARTALIATEGFRDVLDIASESEADEARERYLAERAERTGVEEPAAVEEEVEVEAEEAPAAGVDEELIRKLEEFRRERLGGGE